MSPMEAELPLALQVDRAHDRELFVSAGSRENTALSRSADVTLAADEVRMVETISALACSPMFALVAAEYHDDLRRTETCPHPATVEAARLFALRHFGARLFLAGQLSRRVKAVTR